MLQEWSQIKGLLEEIKYDKTMEKGKKKHFEETVHDDIFLEVMHLRERIKKSASN